MIWIIAFALLAIMAVEGYYAGGIRASFALLALVLACCLAMPLAPITKPLLGLFDINHPILIAVLSPIIAWIVVVFIVRSLGETANYRITYFYKYKVEDNQRVIWERLNRNQGLCVGLLNGAFYLFAIGVVAFVLGYPMKQVASSEADPWFMRLVNTLNGSMQQTGMDKAIAPFVPASELYYDASDIMGLVFHNRLAESRLASYPPFFSVVEQPNFKVLVNDKDFEEKYWLAGKPIRDLLRHEKVKPLLQDPEYYQYVLKVLGGDLKDFKHYMETGLSEKYDPIKILGHWDANILKSYKLARRQNLNMPAAERLRIRRTLDSSLSNVTLMVYVDNKLVFRAPVDNGPPKLYWGTWKEESGNKYALSYVEASVKYNVEATVESRRLTYLNPKDSLPNVYDR